MASSAPTDIISSSPFSKYIDSPEYSDVLFRIIEEEDDGEDTSLLVSDTELNKVISEEFVAEKKEKVRIFHGHKNILAAISPWFNIIFTNGMKESLQNEITVSGVKHDIFHRLLKYCYTFKIEMDGVDDAYELLKASDRFQISNIREECLRYLRQELNEENIWDIWECAGKFFIIIINGVY